MSLINTVIVVFLSIYIRIFVSCVHVRNCPAAVNVFSFSMYQPTMAERCKVKILVFAESVNAISKAY